jgi:hypothetical protein
MGMKLLARMALVLTLVTSTVVAQTKVTAPKNKYTPEQDVQIGREAAAEVRREYPLIDDDQVEGYLERLGERLVEMSPPELNKPVFDYSFTPVNLRDINAFALPGGPMFVNRGMIEAAGQEAEVVGVMAHELAHVLLRHGTANATKAQGFQIGAIAGAIAGAVIGGGWGEVISQGTQFGLGTWFMKYSRDYEKQADLLGAQIMARSGYDPRALARMFETIEKESKGRGGPQWLSSHPNPGNRTQYINAEAAQLRVAPQPADAGFRQARSRLSSMPPARSMADLERTAGNGEGSRRPPSVGRIGEPVPPPARQYRTVRGGDLFQVSVPTNWTELSSNNSIKFVPQNGYGQAGNQETMTHGVELGVARASSRDLRQATETLVEGFVRSNQDMRVAGAQRAMTLSGRQAIGTLLEGRSAVGGRELVELHTTFLRDGNLFYYLTVVPDREQDLYSTAFERVARSIRLSDR